jgi:transcriptional regulator of heat shock response
MAHMSQQPAEKRQRDIFRIIVREYLRSAEPIGSAAIAARHDLGVSTATIRNDMAELEYKGLIEQPHTSAGRVPTEQGYRYYVDEFVGAPELASGQRGRIEQAIVAVQSQEAHAIRAFAKSVAQLSGETVFVHFGDESFLTGVSNLVSKPEFRDASLMTTVSHAVDDLDVILKEVEKRPTGEIEIFIGRNNPFGRDLSTILTAVEPPLLGKGTFGIIGPTRMDYDANVALLRYVRERFRKLGN